MRAREEPLHRQDPERCARDARLELRKLLGFGAKAGLAACGLQLLNEGRRVCADTRKFGSTKRRDTPRGLPGRVRRGPRSLLSPCTLQSPKRDCGAGPGKAPLVPCECAPPQTRVSRPESCGNLQATNLSVRKLACREFACLSRGAETAPSRAFLGSSRHRPRRAFSWRALQTSDNSK